jgi:hypothetical protein
MKICVDSITAVFMLKVKQNALIKSRPSAFFGSGYIGLVTVQTEIHLTTLV